MSESSLAALSDCRTGEISGFVSTDKELLEIVPLTDEQREFFLRFPEFASNEITDLFDDENQILIEDLYIVKRAQLPSIDDAYKDLGELGSKFRKLQEEQDPRQAYQVAGSLTLELAVFVDKTSYANLKEQRLSDEIINEYVLATTNQISALLAHPSLGQKIDVTLVHLEILKDDVFENFDGNAIKYYKSFCE